MSRDKYEKIGKQFRILDEELGIDLEGNLEFSEKEHFPDGQLRFESYRKEEKLHGPSIYYDKSGQILSETWYFEGGKVGKVYRFFSTGELYSLERFVKGVPHLAQEYYYLDGTLKTIIHYEKGVFHGETKLFWPDGTLKRHAVFSNGKKQSDEFYDEEGHLIGDTKKALS